MGIEKHRVKIEWGVSQITARCGWKCAEYDVGIKCMGQSGVVTFHE